MIEYLSHIDFTLVIAFVIAVVGWLYNEVKNTKAGGISALAHGIADQAVEHALMGATGILDSITPANAADRVDAWVWTELGKHGIAKNAAVDLLVKPAIADGVSRVLAGIRDKLAADDSANTPLGGRVAAKTPQAGFAHLRLLAFVAVAGLVGCAWFTSERKAVASDVIDCTKAEAKNAITEFGPAIDALLVLATGGDGNVDTAQLGNAAKNFGKAVGGCVVADAVARALKPAPADPNAPKASPLVADPGSLRNAMASLYPGTKFHTPSGDL